MSIERYTPQRQAVWDEFVDASRQGTFLFRRAYMDYHSHRFHDHSLLFFAEGRLVALLPACDDGDTLVSHGGLTYGGLVTDSRMTTVMAMAVCDCLCGYMRNHGIARLVSRPTPYIYHTLPADEELYAMHRHGAVLTAREVSSAIVLDNRLKWRTLRRRGVRKAEGNGVTVRCGAGDGILELFWQMLDANLVSRHNLHPVHTLAELQLLHSRFPDEMQLFTAWKDNELLGGMLLYVTPQVVHSQYIASTESGKALGALDLVMHDIMQHGWRQRYFDFGKSTEDAGAWLNENLIFQKEGFGARAVCYDTYTLTI